MTGYRLEIRRGSETIEEREVVINTPGKEFSRWCTENGAKLYGNSNEGFNSLDYQEQLKLIIKHFKDNNDWYIYSGKENDKRLMYFSPEAFPRIKDYKNDDTRVLQTITDGACRSIDNELRKYLNAREE